MDTHASSPPGREPLEAALRAAESAPSVLNTRPWLLSEEGGRISVSADPERRLAVADPGARELVLSCGAALYNVRLALRAHGTVPELALLPDPERPGLLAEVGTRGGSADPSDLERLLFDSVPRRRTHRGPFLADVEDVRLVRALISAAAAEGSALHPVTDAQLVSSLAGIVAGAEYLHRHERARSEELARWVRAPGSRRSDGIGTADFPAAEHVAGDVFPGRDYGAARGEGGLAVRGNVTGTVALLTTVEDTRADHLAAGQALQRVLLTATAGGVSAAFHTQPLEEPGLRAFLAEHFCGGARPQMILRLGRARPRSAAREAESAPFPAGM